MQNSFYRDLAQETKAPIPTSSDKTMVVEGVPKDWPCEKGACVFVARYVLRAALEQNCAYVEVRQGAHHRHRFDVGTLLLDVKKWLGGWLPSPDLQVVPVQFATRGHFANGSEMDRKQTMVTVPSSFALTDGHKGEQQ